MITLAATLFVLGILVFVHELGHFLAAKRSGIRVDRFSLGFPPKMIGKKIGDTEYMLSWLPVGGYVKMAGQDDFSPEPGTGKPWEFYSKSIPVRIFVIIAGPLMNWIFAFLLFWSIISIAGVQTITDMRVGDATRISACAEAGIVSGDSILAVNGVPVASWDQLQKRLDPGAGSQVLSFLTRQGRTVDVTVALPVDSLLTRLEPFIIPRIGEVVPGSPADNAGLAAGDVITMLDSMQVERWQTLVSYVHARPGSLINVSWVRASQPMSAAVTPDSQEDKASGTVTGLMGVRVAADRQRVGILKAGGMAAAQTALWTGQIFGFIGDLVTGNASVKNLGGPIRIAQMAGQSARYGWITLLGFMAILSINLAVINVLPLPMFDGGHILIFIVEGVTGRSLSDTQRAVIQYIGLAIILTLTVFVLVNDLMGL